MSTLRGLFAAAGYRVEDTAEHSWRLYTPTLPTCPVRLVRSVHLTGNVRDEGRGMQLEVVDVETDVTLWLPIDNPGGNVAEIAAAPVDWQAVLGVVADLENPIAQRPGMQRRREWAKRLRRALGDP